MEFAICFKGFVAPDRARYLVRQAEAGGFTYCWFYDSHILWRESFVAMAMCMEHTKTMRFGPVRDQPEHARLVGRRVDVCVAGRISPAAGSTSAWAVATVRCASWGTSPHR